MRPQGQQYQRPGQPSQGQPQAQNQGGRPDWNAYYRNNPDLQREYQRNRQNPNYHESPEAYAQRHYNEAGRAEGRQLPMMQGQYQGQYQGQQYRNQYQGQQYNRYGGQDRADHRDWGRYQRNMYAERRYHNSNYVRPQGWYYRRWTFGEFLPFAFWSSQNYWINDYAYFGLPYPPPGCMWIRYGDDALLIDRYTGEIVQVIYGLFY